MSLTLLFLSSEADQKKNPTAVVTALKFYASALKQKEHDKFMITKSVYPSDDDIDVDLVIGRFAGEDGGNGGGLTPRSAKTERLNHGC